MKIQQNTKIEFGDFQTPEHLAKVVCEKLSGIGISPDIVIEPTCGVGAFVLAAAASFPGVREIHGFEINDSYLTQLHERLLSIENANRVKLTQADFFSVDWKKYFSTLSGSILVLGNFPWVTNAKQGAIGGNNLPDKTNFLKHTGLDAITGKANFDISEWMLLEVLRWFQGRSGDVAMLVKTSVARKILAHAERQKLPVREASIFAIDAKTDFNASVEACLLIIRFSVNTIDAVYDYSMFKSLTDTQERRVGHRQGLTVGNLDMYENTSFLVGKCPQKWRSGIKHDATAVMELTRTARGLINGFNEVVDIEPDYLFPLLKGSDVGSEKSWREKFVLVTQRFVGENTDTIRERCPKTWDYLNSQAKILDSRGSVIYKKNPRFSIFGVGEYSFKPWHIAICGLYKRIIFRLVGQIEDKPVMFDDTVYHLSFDSEKDAQEAFDLLNSESSIGLLSALIFWDEKRPIKTSILNAVDWSLLKKKKKSQLNLEKI